MSSPFENLHKLANKARENGWVSSGKIENKTDENKTEEKKEKLSIREASEIIGEESFYGPMDIFKTFSISLEDIIIPEIQFSKAELEKAKELNQELVLYVDKTDTGEPFTVMKMKEILGNKTIKGSTFIGTSWFEADPVASKEVPRFGWRLSDKEPLKASAARDYIGQTEEIVNYLTEVIFKEGIPKEYEEAIQEFDSIKTSLHGPVQSIYPDEWKPTVEKLANLKISQLCRESLVEVVYRIALHEWKHGELLLGCQNRKIYYTWTNSHYRDDILAIVGGGDLTGLDVVGWSPSSLGSVVGVCLSRS